MASSKPITPRIIIHGGAGNITRANLTPTAYQAYRSALLSILAEAKKLLTKPGATSLDVATHAVSLLENNPLFNSGHGAVYTRSGTHELEASVMVSSGYRKRGVGIMLVSRVKNPILMAREMLIRGEDEDGGGAGGHCQLAGETVHDLASSWGMEMCEPSYYWTKRRWDEHRRGLGLSTDEATYQRKRREADYPSSTSLEHEKLVVDDASVDDAHAFSVSNDPSWDGHEYLPQGTVGCVVLDGQGVLCTATSTGGLTNKVAHRIGDTPTIGAGFFAEQWTEEEEEVTPAPHYQQQLTVSQQERMDYSPQQQQQQQQQQQPSRIYPSSTSTTMTTALLNSLVKDCLPSLTTYLPITTPNHYLTSSPSSTSFPSSEKIPVPPSNKPAQGPATATKAAAISGTGNGDSFLRLSAARTACAIARFSSPTSDKSNRKNNLAAAVAQVAGPNGMLQQSAGDRFGRTGEGEGGMIGIEFENSPRRRRGPRGTVVADLNCGGMFRAWVDDEGRERMMVFRDEY
ncbi:hypothetical protein AAFC00_004200 [Neodothiora populina]